MYGDGIGAYQQAGVLTADPKRLVLMCYEEAIRYLKIAKEKYMSRDYEEKAQALTKALDFICALNSAIDFKRGGEVASNLHALYNYVTLSLTDADLKKDLKALDNIIWILSGLRSAWEEIISGRRNDTDLNLGSVLDRKTEDMRARALRA
jgi:flagellar protein FliS